MNTRPLSIYLLKANAAAPNHVLKESPDIQRVQIGQGQHTIGTLFHRPTPARSPRWVSFFQPHVDTRDFLASSTAAVFLVQASRRWFALTFGQGRHLLAPGVYEENFGLRATLNSVNPDHIRVIERQALDASGCHSREQASRNIPIIEFGLDIEKDILRAVTGPPEDTRLGKRLSGADALAVVAEINLSNLRDSLERYLHQYRKTTYRKRFPWVDNVREIGNPEISQTLDETLQQRIRRRQLDRIWMAVPDLILWDEIDGFVYSVGASDAHDDIGFDTYLEQVTDRETLTIEDLRRHRVIGRHAETGASHVEWTVYKCIYAELERDKKTFLLTHGRWYEVASDYVDEVNRSIGKIPSSQRLRFPVYTDNSEEQYNQRVSRGSSGYALIDRKTIRYGGGNSRIEFCDLYTTHKEIVHVKRYTGSSTLSHLFAQGVVSASLFLNDSKFRAEVNRTLPSSHKLGAAQTQLHADQFEVAYAITSKYPGPLDLPFFSRVTLRSSYTQLRNMGYKVSINKIQSRAEVDA